MGFKCRHTTISAAKKLLSTSIGQYYSTNIQSKWMLIIHFSFKSTSFAYEVFFSAIFFYMFNINIEWVRWIGERLFRLGHSYSFRIENVHTTTSCPSALYVRSRMFMHVCVCVCVRYVRWHKCTSFHFLNGHFISDK